MGYRREARLLRLSSTLICWDPTHHGLWHVCCRRVPCHYVTRVSILPPTHRAGSRASSSPRSRRLRGFCFSVFQNSLSSSVLLKVHLSTLVPNNVVQYVVQG